MNLDNIVAIDVHTHAEVSSRDPQAPTAFQKAAQKYFKHENPRPSIAEIAGYYRERKIACVIFPVDGERATGDKPVSNEEVAELAAEHADIMIPFASVDPMRGAAAVREAKRMIDDFGIKGFKFHPQYQEFFPNDRAAYPVYEAIEAAGLPSVFHTGHSGMGTGLPGGGGIRLKYGNPMDVDDVAVDFPGMPIILAHPSWPWQDEALSICLHKPQVYIDLSGWSPKYFPPQLVQFANTQLKHKVLFGTDYPLITPDRWLEDFAAIDIRDEVRPLILKENAARLLKLGEFENSDSG
jgi:predicted TIM-barrel fold metal-dependent hydrolase